MGTLTVWYETTTVMLYVSWVADDEFICPTETTEEPSDKVIYTGGFIN